MEKEIINKLKAQAKERLEQEKRLRIIDASKLSRDEIEKAFHDLQVYQVELEVQNEELISTQSLLMDLSEKYQNLYNYAPIGYLTIKMDGLIEEGNHTFAELVGVSTTNLHGKSIRNWLPREDSLVYYDHRKKLIDTRKAQTFGVRLLCSNQTYIPVQVTLKLDNELHPSQILMIVQDETEIRNLEDAHKNLVQNSAQGMWLFSEEQLVFTNSRACEILGCAHGEFLGFYARDFLSMIDEKHWPEFLKYFDVEGEKDLPDTPVQILFKHKQKSLWLEVFATRSNHKGQPAIQFTFLDITERRLAEEKLAKSEQKFKLAARLASDSIYTADADKRQAKVLSDGKYSSTYNYDFMAFGLDTLLELVDPKQMKTVENGLGELYNKGIELDQVYNLFLPNGKKLVIHHRATVLEWEGGKPKTILGVTTDLTKTKEYEDKLKALNATKDRFFSIIAHDLKNPFNSMLGFAEILMDDFESLSEDEKILMIGKLHGSATNAFKLLENLLSWSRIQTRRFEQIPKHLSLKKKLLSTVELIKPAADQKNIEFVINIPDNINVWVDEDMLSSIVRNLITNAIKFTNSGGEVQLSAVRQTDGMVLISVKDNGIGISDEDMGKLFDVGTKLTKRGTDGESGTGLGLILFKEFVEMSGGHVRVASEPGKGSEFCFTLPESKEYA